MKQYYAVKAVHPDAILLFRVGDFYETFGDDAIKASGILGITLTRRANGAATFVELAGFPYHAIDTYLPKLVRAGERVAICEQLEDPKQVKGLVKRGVIELVTPGVVLGDNILANKENTYLAAVYFGRKNTGVAFLDISTGEFYAAEGSDAYIDKLISNLAPKEIIYQRGYEDRFSDAFGSRHYTYRLDEWVFSESVNRDKLCKQFGTQSLKGFGIEQFSSGISAAGAILYYLEFTEHKNTAHISSISRIDQEDYVWVDKFTIRNLELFSSNGSREKCAFADVVDRTLTPMGGRLLKRWIAMPIKDLPHNDPVKVVIPDRALGIRALYREAILVKRVVNELTPSALGGFVRKNRNRTCHGKDKGNRKNPQYKAQNRKRIGIQKQQGDGCGKLPQVPTIDEKHPLYVHSLGAMGIHRIKWCALRLFQLPGFLVFHVEYAPSVCIQIFPDSSTEQNQRQALFANRQAQLGTGTVRSGKVG